jgi:hypothetical protein
MREDADLKRAKEKAELQLKMEQERQKLDLERQTTELELRTHAVYLFAQIHPASCVGMCNYLDMSTISLYCTKTHLLHATGRQEHALELEARRVELERATARGQEHCATSPRWPS